MKASANIIGLLDQSANDWKQTRQTSKQDIDTEHVEFLIQQRNAARANKDFITSDKIRDELSAMGIVVKDNSDGTYSWSQS